MIAMFDLFRIVAAFGALYLTLPYLALRGEALPGRPRRPWPSTLARAFVRVSFFFLAAGTILGGWRLYLPGVAMALYALWLAATAAFTVRRVWVADAIPDASRLLLPLFRWLEHRQAEPLVEGARTGWLRFERSAYGILFLILALTCAVRAAWFPLHFVRLQKIESYSRALSLHTLLRGEAWDGDPGVVLLAPLAWASGLSADAALRFSGPIVFVSLLLAAAFCSWRYSGRLSVAYLAAANLAAFVLWRRMMPGEPGREEFAAIYVVLAAAFLRRSWGDCALASITALLLYPRAISPMLLAAGLAIVGASLAGDMVPRIRGLAARRAAAVVPALAVMLVAMVQTPLPPATEYQYEASARTVLRIAREFRTNDWVVVSPGLETAQIYGRGWHVELSDFVAQYSEEQLAQTGFVFPYTAQSLFVFIEKRPLRQPAFSLAHGSGKTPYYYNTRLGRESLQFRAARLMAAFVRAHAATRIYYEDEDLIVYLVPRGSPA